MASRQRVVMHGHGRAGFEKFPKWCDSEQKYRRQKFFGTRARPAFFDRFLDPSPAGLGGTGLGDTRPPLGGGWLSAQAVRSRLWSERPTATCCGSRCCWRGSDDSWRRLGPRLAPVGGPRLAIDGRISHKCHGRIPLIPPCRHVGSPPPRRNTRVSVRPKGVAVNSQD